MKYLIVSLIALAACELADPHTVAADSYEAQQMRCVEQYADRAHIDSCRAKVKLAWSADAGADASLAEFAGPSVHGTAIRQDGGK